MNLKLLLSLLIIVGMMFVNSCGSDEKQPELDKVDSVEDLIQEMDTVATEDTVVAIIPDEVVVKKTPETGSDKPAETTPVARAGDYSSKPLEGHVVSLNGLVMGGNGKVSKAEAQALAGNGNLILFRATNGTVYFVYNEDGTFAGKRLANFAHNDKIGMLGKSKVVNGVNVFMMTLIESM
jgi:outer membrane protein assembly factor BamB